MLIGIDGNEANEVRKDIGARVGSNVVAYQMLWALYKNKNKWGKKHKIAIYLKNKPKKDMPPEDVEVFRYVVLGDRAFWVVTKLMPVLYSKNKPDVLHTFSHYLPIFSPVPMGLTIHDLGFLKYSAQFKKKDYWQLKHWTAKSINISKYIITVSKYSKRDLIKNYPSAKDKVHVIYNSYDSKLIGKSFSKKEKEKTLKKYKISKDYLFFLGTLKPSKNPDGLIQAFSKIKEKSLVLVIAGGKGWMYESINKLVKNLGIEDKVIFTGFVSEKEKAILLQEAKVLISPSFWEGFGIHVLEAFASGTPVIVSDRASLPEIAGDAAIYVDPDSVKSIKQAIEKLIQMKEVEYNKLVHEGLNRLKMFDWSNSAEKLIEVLEKNISQ
ncbi:glycosyltransferase family 4 protein [Candidatus Woesebacteria bacterium]|nr:glycosyltransferase family 4 protein [Candidatus Woesebacteria bacterium]